MLPTSPFLLSTLFVFSNSALPSSQFHLFVPVLNPLCLLQLGSPLPPIPPLRPSSPLPFLLSTPTLLSYHPYIPFFPDVYTSWLTRIYISAHTYIRLGSHVYTCFFMVTFPERFLPISVQVRVQLHQTTGPFERVQMYIRQTVNIRPLLCCRPPPLSGERGQGD